MYAVQFQTTVKNGVIEIPAEYRGRIPEHVRVIVLADEAPAVKADMIDFLRDHPLEVQGFKPLTREESHAR